MIKKIVFDMDGTIADLYSVSNWLDMLRSEDVTPYAVARPMYNMLELREILLSLKILGWKIAVTSWGSMYSTENYLNRTAAAKIKWLQDFGFPYDEVHIVPYGTPKHKVTKADIQILVDDNPTVREEWIGDTIDANNNIIPLLLNLIG